MWGIAPQPPFFRLVTQLVKYCNSPRCITSIHPSPRPTFAPQLPWPASAEVGAWDYPRPQLRRKTRWALLSPGARVGRPSSLNRLRFLLHGNPGLNKIINMGMSLVLAVIHTFGGGHPPINNLGLINMSHMRVNMMLHEPKAKQRCMNKKWPRGDA